MERIVIKNGKVITPYRILKNADVIIEDGIIAYVGESREERVEGRQIDACGNYVAPGFVDIHTHGGGGHDFMDGTVDAYSGAVAMHTRHGTTSLAVTTLASSNEELKNCFEVFRKAKQSVREGANLLGIHLEGPYFSMEQRGAQDPRYIRNPVPEEYEEILKWSDDIIRWSAAPELKGSNEFAKCLKKRNILAAIAHTDATFEQVEEAFENGFTHITHLYSGMSGVRRIDGYRHAGVIESAFLIDDMTVEIIADGKHLPSSLLKLIYKIKGASRIALVTDSMRAAGMPEGETILGSLKDGQRVIVEDGVAKLPDKTAFAGSVATTDRLVRTMVNQAEVPLVDAVGMMTITPAKIIGFDRSKGSLTSGKDADLVIFDEDINIKMTMVNGKVVFKAV